MKKIYSLILFLSMSSMLAEFDHCLDDGLNLKMMLVASGEDSAEMLQRGIKAGGDVNKHCQGTALIDWASSSKNQKMEKIRLLLDAGAKITKGAFHTILLNGNAADLKIVIQAAMNAGIDFNDPYLDDVAIQWAQISKVDSAEKVKILQAAGAKMPRPSFSSSLSGGSLEDLEYWIKSGADVNSPIAGLYPVEWVATDHKVRASEKLQALIAAGANIHTNSEYNLLQWAISSDGMDKPELVKTLIDLGFDVNAQDESGATPLHLAARFCMKNKDIFVLMSHGANVNLVDKRGRTPLHRAARFGCVDTIRELASDKNININAQDKFGSTPLHEAAETDQADAIRLLIGLGADMYAKDLQGETPMHRAAKNLRANALQELKMHGANFDRENNIGRTPKDYLDAWFDMPTSVKYKDIYDYLDSSCIVKSNNRDELSKCDLRVRTKQNSKN